MSASVRASGAAGARCRRPARCRQWSRLPAPAARLRRQRHPLSAGEDRRPADRNPIEAQGPAAVDQRGARSPTPRKAGYRALRIGAGEARLDAHRAVDERKPPRPLIRLRRMPAKLAAVLHQIAGHSLRRVGLHLEAAPIPRVERLYANGGVGEAAPRALLIRHRLHRRLTGKSHQHSFDVPSHVPSNTRVLRITVSHKDQGIGHRRSGSDVRVRPLSTPRSAMRYL